jgi:mycothiol synthase
VNLYARSFSGESDKQHMADLSSRFPASHLRLIDLPYRLSSWALDDPENGRLWFTAEGDLAAWAVMQPPFWTIDYSLDPAAEPHLLPVMLEWAEDRARTLIGTPYERPCWFIITFSGNPQTVKVLEDAGFSCQDDVGENSWSIVWMERPGGMAVKDYRVPAGYTVRPLAGAVEVAAYVELHQSVFESKNMTAAWRERTLRHPDYLPELDLVVEAPDGRLAAFCIAWLYKRGNTLTGQIEPLGCHKDYRHLALGRLALVENLRRLNALGAQAVYVDTDNYRNTAMRLYENVGFEIKRHVHVFRRDVR